MKPEDVPEELIDLAMTGAKPGCRGDAAFYLANVLPAIAAELPAHERQVRERVAAEIRETARSLREDGQISQDGWRGYMAAAYIAQEGDRIARGES